MHVLFLEDQPDIRCLITYGLENDGIEVTALENGKLGLEYLDDHQMLPDLIVTDLNMPEMDGGTFVRAVRSHSRFKSIPIILYSGESNVTKVANDIGLRFAVSKSDGHRALLKQVDHCRLAMAGR